MMTTNKPVVGVIMLNTHFPRLLGDIGNADTFSCDVIYEIVPAAVVANIVTTEKPVDDVSAAIIDAAVALQSRGASVIATSCGFLGSLQQALSQCVSIPVIATGLLHLAWLKHVIAPTQSIGILTFDEDTLNEKHFSDLQCDRVVIAGLDSKSELVRVIAQDLTTLDAVKARGEVAQTTQRLLARRTDIGAIVLECTNLSPYRSQIRQLTHKPILDIIDLISWTLGFDCRTPTETR